MSAFPFYAWDDARGWVALQSGGRPVAMPFPPPVMFPPVPPPFARFDGAPLSMSSTAPPPLLPCTEEKRPALRSRSLSPARRSREEFESGSSSSSGGPGGPGGGGKTTPPQTTLLGRRSPEAVSYVDDDGEEEEEEDKLDLVTAVPHEAHVWRDRLAILKHAATCPGGCGQLQCGTFKAVLEHITSCSRPACSFSHCASSRCVLAHAKHCVDDLCPVCSDRHPGSGSRLASTRKKKSTRRVVLTTAKPQQAPFRKDEPFQLPPPPPNVAPRRFFQQQQQQQAQASSSASSASSSKTTTADDARRGEDDDHQQQQRESPPGPPPHVEEEDPTMSRATSEYVEKNRRPIKRRRSQSFGQPLRALAPAPLYVDRQASFAYRRRPPIDLPPAASEPSTPNTPLTPTEQPSTRLVSAGDPLSLSLSLSSSSPRVIELRIDKEDDTTTPHSQQQDDEDDDQDDDDDQDQDQGEAPPDRDIADCVAALMTMGGTRRHSSEQTLALPSPGSSRRGSASDTTVSRRGSETLTNDDYSDKDDLDERASFTSVDTEGTSSKPPPRFPFLIKLQEIVADEKNRDIIRWDNKELQILNKLRFEEEVMPQYFTAQGSRSRFSSFSRQLNNYGFENTLRGPKGCPVYRHVDPNIKTVADFLKVQKVSCIRSARTTSSAAAPPALSSAKKPIVAPQTPPAPAPPPPLSSL